LPFDVDTIGLDVEYAEEVSRAGSGKVRAVFRANHGLIF
jgi:hypothetical protein